MCGPGFNERVWEVVRGIPPGRVTTYGAVGAALGSPRVARQVGWALAALPPHLAEGGRGSVPWHRVINARGAISHRGDFVRAEVQRRRLEAEGIPFDGEGRCDLRRHAWWPDGCGEPGAGTPDGEDPGPGARP